MGYGLGLACAAELLVGYSILEIQDLGPSFPCLGLRFSVFVFCLSLSLPLSLSLSFSLIWGRQGVAGLAAFCAN